MPLTDSSPTPSASRASRTFYLQARERDRQVTVVLEKVQVALMAERLVELLDAIRERGVELPPIDSGDDDTAPLDEPIHGGLPGRHHRHGLGRRARPGDDRDPVHRRGRRGPARGRGRRSRRARPRARLPRRAGRLRLHPSRGQSGGRRPTAMSHLRRAARPAGPPLSRDATGTCTERRRRSRA